MQGASNEPSVANRDARGETLLRDTNQTAESREDHSPERLIDQTALAGLGHMTSGLLLIGDLP